MIEIIGPFYAAFVRAQEDPARRDAELAGCERSLRRLSSLRPPDARWAALRDGLVAEYRYWLELVRTEPFPAYDINAAPALERWRAMQEEAAQAQKNLATPTRRRRGEAIWFSTTAAATILIGLGRLPSILYRGTFSLDVALTGVSFVVAAWALREAGLRFSGRRGPGWV